MITVWVTQETGEPDKLRSLRIGSWLQIIVIVRLAPATLQRPLVTVGTVLTRGVGFAELQRRARLGQSAALHSTSPLLLGWHWSIL